MKRVILAFLMLALAASANASPIVPGQWYEFAFTAVGVDATGCSPADPAGGSCTPSSGGNSVFAPAPPWTIVVGAGGATLTVTDAFLYGDQFNVYNFGALLGFTPDVAPSQSSCGSDPVACLADPLSSHASFFLAPGSYSFTIAPWEIITGGAAYFQVANAVPDAGSTLLLLGLGLAGLRAWKRR